MITESHLRLPNSVLEELILRDFSKRERKIIDLILRLSWACNKNFAVIPEMKYFELCGIHKQDIRKALEFLVSNNVIFWDREVNIFEINRDFDAWHVPYSRLAEKKLICELVSINLRGKVSKKLTECVNSTEQVSKNPNP